MEGAGSRGFAEQGESQMARVKDDGPDSQLAPVRPLAIERLIPTTQSAAGFHYSDLAAARSLPL